MPRPLAAFLLLSPFVAAVLPAQEVLWERVGVDDQLWFFSKTAVLGDVDGDGCGDVAAIVRERLPDQSLVWRLWVLSGRDGRTLRASARDGVALTWVVATGDMNGDGIGDYALNVRFPPEQVEVRSGADDSLLWNIGVGNSDNIGRSILGDLDVDGDGRRDLIVMEPRNLPVPVFDVYSNLGSLLYRVTPQAGDRPAVVWPENIGRIGDLDGDGGDEWAFGVSESAAGRSGASVVCGRTGALLRRDVIDFAWLHRAVHGVGDHDGDGVPDYAVASGAPSTTLDRVVVFSGRTGGTISEWRSTDPFADLGSSLTGADLDGDGVTDLLVGDENFSGANGAYLGLSGRDGGLLLQSEFDPEAGGLGNQLQVLRPFADEAFPVILGPDGAYRGVGRIRAYRGAPARSVAPFGTACQGGLPAEPRLGLRDRTRSGGTGTQVHLSAAPPGVHVCLLLGLSNTTWTGIPLPLDLTLFGLPGCALHVSPDVVAPRVTGSVGLDRGYARADLPLQLADALGLRVYGQWLLLGPGDGWPGGLTRPLSWIVAR